VSPRKVHTFASEPDPYEAWDEPPVDEDAELDEDGEDPRLYSASLGRFISSDEAQARRPR
jgi:hypothetical protein